MTALTDTFPSRRTSVWGGFRAVEIIPIRYGDVRGRCVEYQTTSLDDTPRRKWVWSDGACAGIDEVYVSGQRRFGGWVSGNRIDATGKAVMMIEFTIPVPSGAEVSARGRGRVSDGAMIRNPGRVIADLFSLAGVSNPGLDSFTFDCEQLGIELSGEVSEESTIQGVVRSICESIGAIYSPRLRNVAAIYPGGPVELVGASPLIWAEIDSDHLESSQFDVGDVINAVTVAYAMRDGRPTKTMDLDAPQSILTYGRRPAEISAEWISDDGIMANIATRLLEHRARAPHVIRFSSVRADLRPGDWVSVDGTASPVPFATGDRQVVATEYDIETGRSSGELEIYAGTTPVVRIVGQATILETEQTVQHSVESTDTERRVTLKNPDGSPMAGVKCVLDGRVTRFADAAGVVTFPLADAPAGRHTLTVTLTATASTDPTTVNFGGEGEQSVVPSQVIRVPVTFNIEVFFQ